MSAVAISWVEVASASVEISWFEISSQGGGGNRKKRRKATVARCRTEAGETAPCISEPTTLSTSPLAEIPPSRPAETPDFTGVYEDPPPLPPQPEPQPQLEELLANSLRTDDLATVHDDEDLRDIAALLSLWMKSERLVA